jgi:hypothetical protein
MKALFLLLSVLLTTTGSKAWAQSEQDLAILKSQSLVILLKDEDPGKLKKLARKPGELADYRAFVADYNTQVQAWARAIWHFSPAVECKQESEMPAMLKDKSFQHGVLRHDNFNVMHHFGGAARGGATYYAEAKTAFVLSIVDKGTRRGILDLAMDPGPVYASDIIFCLKTLENVLQDRASGKSVDELLAVQRQKGTRLRVKTLLLDEAKISSDLTAADIQELYPYPCQVVPRATIETAVKEADARYAYVRAYPLSDTLVAQVIMDIADGYWLFMSTPNGMSFKSGRVIGKAQLKAFAKAAQGK